MGRKVLTPPSHSQSSNSLRLLWATDIHAEPSVYGPQTLMFTISTITPLWWWTNKEQGREHDEGWRGSKGDWKGQYWNLRSEKTIVESSLVCPIHLVRCTLSRCNKRTQARAHWGMPYHRHHQHQHTYAWQESLLSQAIQYKDTQSSGNNLILPRDVIGFDRQAEPHGPGCSPRVTNKTDGLVDDTELNMGKLKIRAKTKHGEKQYWTDPKWASNKSY